MENKKAKDLRGQQIEELEANLSDLRAEKYNLLNEIKESKKVEKGHLLRRNRRSTARHLTVLNEKKLATESSAQQG